MNLCRCVFLILCCFIVNIHANSSSVRIITPSNSNNAIKVAAEELQLHLFLITGEKAEIQETNQPETVNFKDGIHFLIGLSPAENSTAKGDAEYFIRANRVYFRGVDNLGMAGKKSVRETICDLHGSQLGTLDAVYCFLENELGVKWLSSGISGIVYDRSKKMIWNENKDFSWSHELQQRNIRSQWHTKALEPYNSVTPEQLRYSAGEINEKDYQSLLWLRRMHMGYNIQMKYGHAFRNWWEKYGKTHPEYFGLNKKGVRGPATKNVKRVKICVSNPAVVEQVISDWKAEGCPEYLNICENDGTPGFCRCQQCLALDTRTPNESFLDHLTDRYVYFWNRVAEKAVAIRPDVKVVTYAYSYYRLPPRREKVAAAIIIGMVPMLFDDVSIFSGWKKAGANRIFLRPNDMCSLLPLFRGLEKIIYDNFHNAFQLKMIGVDYDGSPWNKNLDMEYYVISRMVAFPQKSFDEIVSEYYSSFGAASAEVKSFYEFQRELGIRRVHNIASDLEAKKVQLLDYSQIDEQPNISTYYSYDDFSKGRAILEKGLEKKLTESERARLHELLLVNEHSQLTYSFMVEANKARSGKTNNISATADRLLNFRIKNRDNLNFPWSLLWGRMELKNWELLNNGKKKG